ncbi:MAG: glycosyltransferase [Magnetococcales bacterium]|nr:glycosyltransferase [Magnetococcales bacterium]
MSGACSMEVGGPDGPAAQAKQSLVDMTEPHTSLNASVVASNPLLLSVVVPVYLNAATLEELDRRIRVALAGLSGEHERIYVHDAGEDNSLEILKTLSRKDPRVRVIALPEIPTRTPWP